MSITASPGVRVTWENRDAGCVYDLSKSCTSWQFLLKAAQACVRTTTEEAQGLGYSGK